MMGPVHAPQAKAWFEAARVARPASPMLAWLEAVDCQGLSDACDPAAARERLMQLAPDNAAAHLLALNAQVDSGDLEGARAALARAARADVFDDYMQDMLTLLLEASDGVDWPPMDPGIAETLGTAWGIDGPMAPADFGHGTLVGFWIAIAMPGIGPLSTLCSGEEPSVPDAEVRADCKAMYTTIAGSEANLMWQGLALANLASLTEGTDEGAAWRERLRDHYWLTDQGAARMAGLPGSGITIGQWFRWWAEGGEAEATRQALRRHGIPVEAPDDWLPADARRRALVTTGVAP
jgi:hypothetical protein